MVVKAKTIPKYDRNKTDVALALTAHLAEEAAEHSPEDIAEPFHGIISECATHMTTDAMLELDNKEYLMEMAKTYFDLDMDDLSDPAKIIRGFGQSGIPKPLAKKASDLLTAHYKERERLDTLLASTLPIPEQYSPMTRGDANKIQNLMNQMATSLSASIQAEANKDTLNACENMERARMFASTLASMLEYHCHRIAVDCYGKPKKDG